MKKRINIEFFMYLFASLLYAKIKINYGFYLAFIFSCISSLINYKKTKDNFYFLKIIFLSIIIPSNYLTIVLLLFNYILGFKNDKSKYKADYFLISVSTIFTIINCLNNFHLINFAFSVVYLFPIILTIKYFNKNVFNTQDKIKGLLRSIVIIELLSIVFYFIFNYNAILTAIDNDWVVGTFGYHQGNIFLYFMNFCILFFKNDYSNNKDRKNLIYIIMCFFMMILTNSIALIIMFLLSYFIITFITTGIRKKIPIAIAFTFALIGFVVLTPSWILNHIVELTNFENKNYIYANIPKLNTYEDTFHTIPQEDTKFLIIGNGAGEYSSRAALTCTGAYIGFYNKLFNVSMSEYTIKYIYFNYIKNNIVNGFGTMYSPFSTIITIQGEYGIIGLIIFIICILTLLVKSNINSKIFILFFVESCFIENYLEFPKIIFIILYIYYIRKSISLNSRGDIK